MTNDTRSIPVLYGLPALILVDQQMGGGNPPTINCPGCDQAMDNTVPLLTSARKAGLPIVHLQEFHRKELVDYGHELDGDEGVHCLEATPAVELYPPLAPVDGEWLLQKRRYSGFFATDLDLLLRGLGVQTVILTGQLTNVCVHYTAIDAHQYNYVVRVARDCVAGSSERAHQASLEAMEYHQHGAICSSQEIIEELSGKNYAPTWRIASSEDLLRRRWYAPWDLTRTT